MTDLTDAPAVEDPRQSILAVDDDPEVLAVISTTLEKSDYRVWTAGSAEQALEILDQRGLPAPVRLLLCRRRL